MSNSMIPSQQVELVQFPAAPQVTHMRALPVQAQHHFQEGIVRLQSGDAAGAVAAFSQSLAHAPEFSEGHVFLGIAHSLTYNIYPAIDHLEPTASAIRPFEIGDVGSGRGIVKKQDSAGGPGSPPPDGFLAGVPEREVR